MYDWMQHSLLNEFVMPEKAATKVHLVLLHFNFFLLFFSLPLLSFFRWFIILRLSGCMAAVGVVRYAAGSGRLSRVLL